jgi:hypothetical protein
MMHWLEQILHIQCWLGIGQTPLAVSSDIIESLSGKFKVIVQRNPKAEFNRIVLAIPALCGLHDPTSVSDALKSTTHRDLQRWEKENVHSSQIKLRQQFLAKRGLKDVRAATL